MLFYYIFKIKKLFSLGQEDILPNIAAFPDGPPAPGGRLKKKIKFHVTNKCLMKKKMDLYNLETNPFLNNIFLLRYI